MRKIFFIIVALFLLNFTKQAEAVPIFWDFQGTLSSQTTDPLGINGEVIQLHIEFNSLDTWVKGDYLGEAWYYFPSTASSASITGSNTIAVKSMFPAASISAGGHGGIREAVFNPSYVDFIINGQPTTTFAANGPLFQSVPNVGDNLSLSQLRDDLGSIASIETGDVFYDFVNSSVTKVAVPGPTPPTVPNAPIAPNVPNSPNAPNLPKSPVSPNVPKSPNPPNLGALFSAAIPTSPDSPFAPNSPTLIAFSQDGEVQTITNPEPATLALFGSGIVGMLFRRKRSQFKK